MPVGQPISKKVHRQLAAREEILGKINRSPEDLAWMTSRNVFVRLMSSVNTLSDTEAQAIYDSHDISKAVGSSTTAKDKVLYSLGLAPDASRDQFTNSMNIGAPRPATNLDKNSNLGIRPGSGITNITVKSKNTYGTLREAEISLKIWSKDELELLDELYFRPGYSLLLEWGHTYYYLSDSKKYNGEILTVTDFFKNGQSFEDIEAKIDKLRIKSDYNYDAMMGYCSNFGWSLNNDGSYDATVKIISRGAIIESLKSNADPLSHISPKYLEDSDEEEGKKQRKSIFHFVLNAMEKYGDDGIDVNRDDIVSEIPDLDKILPKRDKLAVRADSDLADTGWIFEDSINLQWISLGTFCALINKAVMPHSGDGRTMAKMNTKYDEEREAEQIAKGLPETSIVRTTYVTHPDHFSVDPYVCFLPTIPVNGEIAKEAVVDLYDKGLVESAVTTVVDAATSLWDWVTGSNTVSNKGVQPRMIKIIQDIRKNKFQSANTSSKYLNNTLDICVSNYYLYEILDSIYDQKEGDKSLFAIFRSLLDGINDALGGINELDLYFNEDDNLYYIIDRKLSTPDKAPPELRVSGLGHSVLDLKISTKISNEMSSMISIASQGTRPSTQEEVDVLMTWNRGKIDRFMPSKNQESDDKVKAKDTDHAEQKKKDYENWLADLDDTFGHFCNRWGRNQKYRKSDHEALKSFHKSLNSELISISQQADGKPPVGVIPLELSLKLEGIAGLKVAESFNIDTNVLPSKYSRFSYIITGLDHTIENQRWVTNVKTQFYISETPSEAARKAAQNKSKGLSPDNSSRGGGSGGSGGGNSGGGTPPKVEGKTMKGDNISYASIKKAVLTDNHKWFDQAWRLNIIGIRNMSNATATQYGWRIPGTNKFDDLMVVAWKDDKGNEFAEAYQVSTDPGYYFMTNIYPGASGTGIMKEGQYVDIYRIGYHNSDKNPPKKHLALVQTGGKVTAYRDANKDYYYDLDSRKTETGYFGMNIHKGTYNVGGAGVNVGAFSAGCQVFQKYDQHNRFMELCTQQRDKGKYDKYSYTLLLSENPIIKQLKLI